MVHQESVTQTEGSPQKDREISLVEEKGPEQIRTEEHIWDEARKVWILGKKNEYTWCRDVVDLEWTGVTQNTTDNKPDSDKVIDIRFARSIDIQISTLNAEVTNASTDLDINVITSVDDAGAIWDSSPYAEANIGDNAVKSFLVNPGAKLMRLRLDENNSGAGGAKCRVLVRY